MLAKDRTTLLCMLDSINTIGLYTKKTKNVDDWLKNQQNIDSCLIHIINIGEMVTRLSDPFIVEHDQIDWFSIRGLRNVVAHDYFGVDFKEIWVIITEEIPILKDFILSVI